MRLLYTVKKTKELSTLKKEAIYLSDNEYTILNMCMQSAYNEKKLVVNVKYGGGSVVLKGCVVACRGPGDLVKADVIMNFIEYKDILSHC